MLQAYLAFNRQIDRCKELDAIYHYLKEHLRFSQDLSDFLRAQVVYSVSALDRLLHDLIKIGMIQIFDNMRPATNKFSTFSISTDTLKNIRNTYTISLPQSPEETPQYWFEKEILLKHKTLSFQDPDKISEGLSNFWNSEHKWQEIYIAMSPSIVSLSLQTEQDLKIYLKNIIIRRNQIVHEGDMNFDLSSRNTIETSDVKKIIFFIEHLGTSIYNLVKI